MAHALVIGGTRGLGREAVKLFSAAGYKVSVIGRREPPDTDRTIPGVKHWIADLGPEANIGATLDAIVKDHGPLNYLVFCQRYRGNEDPWKGEIDVSPMWHNDALTLAERGVPVGIASLETGIAAARYSLNIVKNPSAGLDRAVAYVDAMLSVAAQAQVVGAPYFYIPSNNTVDFPPQLAASMGIESVDDFIAMAHNLDWPTINPQRADWIERFNQTVQS